MGVDTFVRITPEMDRKVRAFLYNSALRAEWLRDDVMEVYVRKSMRRIRLDKNTPPTALDLIWVFDIANIIVEDKYQGKGYFREFVRATEKAISEIRPELKGIYIENVQTPRFMEGLLRMGFVPVSSSGVHSWDDCLFAPSPMPFPMGSGPKMPMSLRPIGS